MKVLHTYCLNYNIGDYALGIGLKNLLRNYLNIDLIGETNIQGQYFTEYYIDEVVNKKYDFLVIGGGGIIHGAHWPNGWFWLIDLDLIKRIKIPFLVYGVGNNYFENETLIPEKAIIHLTETKKRAVHFSVRNDGSKERLLNQTGLTFDEVPDPGFFVGLNRKFKRPVSGPYIIIQLANDKPENRFGSHDSKVRFIKSLRNILKDLSKKYKIIFAPHVFDDIALSKEISEGINNCSIWEFGYYAFDNCLETIGYYKYAEFVIAMRGHGQIVPFSFNVPVISIENHPKHGGLMNKLGFSNYNIKLDDEHFEGLLYDRINSLRNSMDELKFQYNEMNKLMFQSTSNTFQKIKTILNE
jgi:polysaccharide pyruvyl transferase WcaK-like protein